MKRPQRVACACNDSVPDVRDTYVRDTCMFWGFGARGLCFVRDSSRGSRAIRGAVSFSALLLETGVCVS